MATQPRKAGARTKASTRVARRTTTRRTRTQKKAGRRIDRHDLYEKSVQCPEADVIFFDRVFKKKHGRRPTLLREDFCGTAALAAEWVKTRPENRAIGVDLDRPTLNWGIERNLRPLGEAARRVELIQKDVRDVRSPKVDIVAALNFSYFVFKDRQDLAGYFRTVRASLRREGMFFLDIFGGTEIQDLTTETKTFRGFKYHWHQASYNPITNESVFHIHFQLSSGRWLRKAFTYDWRVWTVREVMELLREVGFGDVQCYWEGMDEEGEGDGNFRPAKVRSPEPGWIAYIVAGDPRG